MMLNELYPSKNVRPAGHLGTRVKNILTFNVPGLLFIFLEGSEALNFEIMSLLELFHLSFSESTRTHGENFQNEAPQNRT